MSLLQTPGRVSRTFRNIGRIRQIATVFAKYGFQELMGGMGFSRFIPAKYRKASIASQESAAVRLRKAFEELGPTFVKLGQVLSSRTDLLPESFIEEFVKLQDNVSPVAFEHIKEIIESELNGKLSELFRDFRETPLASASIGQVYEASLPDGTPIVVKVQRPDIENLIKTDVSILRTLAAALERYMPETRVLAPQVFVEEFFEAMSMELDFVVEANNTLKSKANMRSIPEVYIPDVHLSLTTHKVLVIEKLPGKKLDDTKALEDAQLDIKLLANTLAKAFLHSTLEDGFFHGDLHSGNLFALAPKTGESAPRLGLIDFGVVGYLTPRARESLLRIFIALAAEDFESLCMEYTELGSSRGHTDLSQFQRQLQAAIAPFLGIPLQSINVGRVLMTATNVAARHQIRVPREWMMVFKALYTLEGTCRKLDPSFNAAPFLENYLGSVMQPKTSWEDFSKDMVLGSRDLQQMAHGLPRQMHWFFKRLAANNYALEVRNSDNDKILAQNQKNFRTLSSAVYAAALLGVATYLFATANLALAAMLALLSFWIFWRN